MKSWPGHLLCLAVFPFYHTDINLAVYFLSKPEPELQLNCINVQTWASLFFYSKVVTAKVVYLFTVPMKNQ